MDMHYSENTRFVGRTKYITELNNAWSNNKVFGIYGLKAVGKSSYLKRFMEFKRDVAHWLDLAAVQNESSLYISVCSSFDERPDESAIDCNNNAWIVHILEIVHEIPSEVIIVFDNAEDIIEGNFNTAFMQLCTALIDQCEAKIVITSTTKVIFPKHSNIYFTQEMLPLTPVESKSLLLVAAPDVDLDSYDDAIVELSEGLPLLILMIASELEADGGHITPAEMVELLLECRLQTISNSHVYPRVDVLYRCFILRLNEVHRENLVTLDFIPGSFTSRHVTFLLDVGSEAMAKQFAIKPIRERHMLRHESDSHRFNIQGILREVIRANFVIKNLAEVKSRYSRLFCGVMKDIADKMGTSEYTKALAEFSVEQPNLRKLLLEVHDTKQDNYHFFIEIASSCTELIEKYMADQSDAFYGGCLELAERYGKNNDKASVYIAVGSIETLTKGQFKAGEKNYLKALDILKRNEDRHQMAVVYKKLGWNAYKQGFCSRAVEFSQKSLSIYQLGRDEYELITLENLSIMALAWTVLGEFDLAEKYHNFCLNRRKRRFGEVSSAVGKCLNNFGDLFENKGNHPKAYELYKKGLDMKRMCKTETISIADSLSNVAKCLINMGNYEDAHRHLDDAFHMLNKEKIPMLDGLSLVHHTKGKVYAKENRLKEAQKAFAESVSISRMSELKGVVYMERLIDLARLQQRRKQFKACIGTLTEALSYQGEITQSKEHSFDIIRCFKCLSEIYKERNDKVKHVQTLYAMEKECFRLERVCKNFGNKLWTEEVQRELDNTQTELQRLHISDKTY
ncbi:uncharacterized protein LOC128233371 isoform X1 [Mya arenaria]|uniref:uncharacterized protein LOC128233371 isoform X1 n=1 Tax=Mya arenaria TaxID=6604 RepID=UPI0022E799D3|nr:uncharacterized protein LOC128233371 isoform X1 [Mya arenaria]